MAWHQCAFNAIVVTKARVARKKWQMQSARLSRELAMPFAAEHTASTAATYSATFMRLLPLNFAASTLSLQCAYGCAVGERIWTAQLSLLGANTVPLLQLPPAVALFGARSAHESLASRLADCLFDISDTFEYVHVM